MAVATLSKDGSIRIPETLREELKLHTGDEIELEKDPRGLLLLVRPKRADDLGRIPGLLRHRARPRPVSVAEMKRAVLEEAAERDRAARDA